LTRQHNSMINNNTSVKNKNVTNDGRTMGDNS
jgi:hypothetical protein